MRRLIPLLAALLLLLPLAACSIGHGEADPPEYIPLSDWPENRFTDSLPRPEAGTPEYALLSGDACAVFLTGITREEGEAYLQALEEAGFRRAADAQEESAGGFLLIREETAVSVSLSEGTLGIRITCPEE